MSSPHRRRARRALAATTAAALVCAVAATTTAGGAAVAADPPSSGRLTTPAGSSLTAAALAAARGRDAALPGPRALGLPRRGSYSFLLELDTASTAVAQEAARGTTTSSVARAAGRNQVARIARAQSAVVAQLPGDASVLYRTHSALAAVAVRADVTDLAALRGIAGVKAVHPIAPKTRSNAYAVPLQGAPAVWTGGGGVAGNTGRGTSIGIIDTGIDYTHADFGGPGTVAAYTAADAASTTAPNPALFGPGRRVVGGTDLVGDDYDPESDAATAAPQPDPNPLDCEGHGTHVAGSAAGSGVTGDRKTYTGAYNAQTPFSTMRIGPGMAPQADLYAIRVFGCEGSTDVVSEALDYSLDPNGDGDISDHLDVVNLSLGSDFGTEYDADALVADVVAELGVLPVVSAGNSGDIHDVAGSPGTAVRALTVASSVDAQTITDSLKLRIGGTDRTFPSLRSIAYDYGTKPDLAGPVVVAPATGTQQTGCSTAAGASPYTAGQFTGKVVVVKWTEGPGLECGSVQRSTNLAAAGAVGFIFASTSETFGAGITGSTTIPGVLAARSAGDAIRAAATAGTAVVVTGTSAADFTQTVTGDNDTVSSFTSRGTRANGSLKPDVSAVGSTVFSALVGSGTDGETESGTSMSAPMTAGLAALVRTANPTWTSEQVKADIVNTAGQDLYVGQNRTGQRYGPNRVGTGRIQAQPAVANKVLAYVEDDPGAVSVGFGPVEVAGPTRLTKTVTVENLGTTAATYDASYDAITTVPGVSYVVSPARVQVAPGASTRLRVTFTVEDAGTLTKSVDPTRATTNPAVDPSLQLPIEQLADASGHLLLTPASGNAPQLRVAVYSAPRPVSVLSQSPAVAFPTTGGPGTVTVTGTGLDQGTGAAAITSIGAALELQAVSGRARTCTDPDDELCVFDEADRAADLSYVGTASDPASVPAADRVAYFGIATQGAATTPAYEVEHDVVVDVDGDGAPDLLGYNSRLPQGADYTDVFTVDWYDLKTTKLVDVQLLDNRAGDLDLAVFDSDVQLLPVSIALLQRYGLSAARPRVTYGIQSSRISSERVVDQVGVDLDGQLTGLSFNPLSPGLSVVDAAAPAAAPFFLGADGEQLGVTRDPATLAADGALGLMVVHFHNAVGNKAQVVELPVRSVTRLVATPAAVQVGQPTTLSVDVTRASGATRPTGTVTVVDTTSGTTVGTVPLTGGRADLVYRPATVGTTTLVARYAGDGRAVDASQSAPVSLAVTATPPPPGTGTGAGTGGVDAPVRAKLSFKRGPVGATTKVKVKVATVGATAPTGTVQLRVDGKKAGSKALKNGKVTFRFQPTARGLYKLRAVYKGSPTYDVARSKTLRYAAF